MLLMRRIKQAIAEWYLSELLEKSRGGMETSVEQRPSTTGATSR